jgi:hypothetical protein
MKIRLIGLGQCGSRITYDFFAFLSNSAPSHKINTIEDINTIQDILKSMKQKKIKDFISINTLKEDFKAIINSITDQGRILEWLPEYIIGDLNPNNQIFALLAKTNQQVESESEPAFFKGNLLYLGGRSGGCGNYQILGQSIMDAFLNNQKAPGPNTVSCKNVAESRENDLTIFAYSAGGGTGSGTCPILSDKVYQNYNQINNQKAVINVVILPEGEGEAQNTPLQITAGRTICLLQNNRYNRIIANPDKVFSDANMLLSNSIAGNDRILREEMNNMNLYVSSNILEMAHASSTGWTVKGRNTLAIKEAYQGESFISGYAESEHFGAADENLVIKLFAESIGSFKETKSGINSGYKAGCGASVLLGEPIDVQAVLQNTLPESEQKTEFRTASKVIFYFGMPAKDIPENRINAIDNILDKLSKSFFPDAATVNYLYYHVSSNFTLMIHIINSFINEAYDLFLRYLDSAWKWNNGLSGNDLAEMIDSVVFDKHSNIGEIRNFLNSNLKAAKEDYDISVFSDWNKVKSEINDKYLVDIDSIAAALLQFSNQYHRKRDNI